MSLNFFILFLAFCLPAIGGAGFALRPIVGLLALGALFSIPFSMRAHAVRHFMAYIVAAFISTLLGGIFLDIPLGYQDFFELLRLFLPCVMAWLGFLLARDRQTERSIILLCIFIFFIGFSQFLKIDSGVLTRIYSASSQLDGALGEGMDYTRNVFTLGNPNDAGMFLCFIAIYFFSRFLNGSSQKYALLSAISVFCILLTQSKTAIFAVFIGSVTLLIIKRRYILLFCIFVFFVLALFSLKEQLIYVWNFINQVYASDLMSIHVFSARLENSIEAFELWEKSPFFGWGVAKSTHPTIVDVEYGLVLRRYGILGALFLLFFLIETWKIGSDKKLHDTDQALSNFLQACVPLIIIFMISNNFFNSYYNSYFVFYMLGRAEKLRHVSSKQYNSR